METCQRCGEEGQDRRTLWMACFYNMDELGMPTKLEVLLDADASECTPAKEPGKITVGGQSINLSSGTVRCSGELTPRGFYTLRVCKKCRADWMTMIKAWWEVGRA